MEHGNNEPGEAEVAMINEEVEEEVQGMRRHIPLPDHLANPHVQLMALPEDDEFDDDDDFDFEIDEEEAAADRAFLRQEDNFADDNDDFLDTTAEEVAAGKDVQGIPWTTTPWTREAYREKRNTEYKSYMNLEEEVLAAAPIISKTALVPKELHPTLTKYSFYRNWRAVRSTIVHFQLRNLLWPVSAHDIYYVANNRVVHWNNLVRGKNPDTVLDLGMQYEAVNVCTMCAKHGIVAAGGFSGELVTTRVQSSLNNHDATGTTFRKNNNNSQFHRIRVSSSDNGITNAIDIYKTPTGAIRLACSNNDQAVRLFDATAMTNVTQFNLPWAVNSCVAHPSGRLLCAVGDDPNGVLLDPATGATVARLTGHIDYSFAAAWHPDGNIIATGNQDLTTRVFDLRMTSRVLCVLRGHIGAVRSLRFSPDGRSLAVAEPADYVSVYDVGSGYTKCQTIDLFGEIAGIGFSPDSERFFASVADVHYASLLQFNRKNEGGRWVWGEGGVEGARRNEAD